MTSLWLSFGVYDITNSISQNLKLLKLTIVTFQNYNVKVSNT